MKSIVFFFICSLTMLSCNKNDDKLSCYSFDVRQCQTDLYANDVPETDNRDDREAKMEIWLESKGYEIEEIKLVLNYHEAVCEACHVCPLGDRYFIQKENSENETHPDSLLLLSYEAITCDGIF